MPVSHSVGASSAFGSGANASRVALERPTAGPS